MQPSGQLVGEQAIRSYVTAGKARFTLRSESTETRFTYRVKAPKNADGSIFFVSVLIGPDNSNDFRYLGYIRKGEFRHGGAKAIGIGAEAPSVKAFGWFWRNLAKLEGKCEVFHDGRCGRCGRDLTVPESVASGLGPECAGRMPGVAKATKKKVGVFEKHQRAIEKQNSTMPRQIVGVLSPSIEDDELEMQQIEAEGDRAETAVDEYNKWRARLAVEGG